MSTENQPSTDPSRIDRLRQDIDWCDSVIISYILYRSSISRQIGAIKKEAGFEPIDLAREADILQKYQELGSSGKNIIDNILVLGRGELVEEHNNEDDCNK